MQQGDETQYEVFEPVEKDKRRRAPAELENSDQRKEIDREDHPRDRVPVSARQRFWCQPAHVPTLPSVSRLRLSLYRAGRKADYTPSGCWDSCRSEPRNEDGYRCCALSCP